MLKKFFWTCSGADQDILSACPKSEQEKYAGIGATVFFTALLAALSGGYALFTIFDSIFMAVAFALIWGLVIFNLDRFIVSTMRKEKGLKHELIQASPRIILAILIAIVISKPLEIKIFEKEIDRVLLSQRNQSTLENKNEIQANYQTEIDRLQSEITASQADLDAKKAEVDELYDIYIGEAEGTSGTQKLGKGPVYAEKREKHDMALQDLQSQRAEHSLLQNQNTEEIASLRENMRQEVAETQPIIDGFDGFLARLTALEELPKWPQWFIILLFIALETAPILTKLLSHKGPYDVRLAFSDSQVVDVLEAKRAQLAKLQYSESVIDETVYESIKSDDEVIQYRKQRARIFLNAKTDAFFDEQGAAS